jgi:hypothetical protein
MPKVQSVSSKTGKSSPGSWRSRIVGHEMVDAEQLLAHPQNWRVHPQNQQNIMESLLDEVGWLDEVKVNQNTGLVVDGHMRAAIAISKGEQVPVCYLDLTPEEEALALATFNPIGALAVPDESALNEVIGNIGTCNPEIATFLDGLYSEVNASAIRRADGEGGVGGEPGTEGTKTKESPVRMLMRVPEIEIMEQAIIRTGAPTRGEAVLEICRHYLNS